MHLCISLSIESNQVEGVGFSLLKRYSAGEGVPADPTIAHDLFKHAAELGDPDAQADMAVRHALGLQPTSGTKDLLYGLGSPDIPAALLNYFFAAAGNDSFAQMALGYRHMYGVDVPQSCQAGLLYYNPVAEQVVEAARYPGQLPQVLLIPVTLCILTCICTMAMGHCCLLVLCSSVVSDHPTGLAQYAQYRQNRKFVQQAHNQLLSCLGVLDA